VSTPNAGGSVPTLEVTGVAGATVFAVLAGVVVE
jgi:hypothetical protein